MSEELEPPVPRYRLTVTIDGNSHDELERELHFLLNGGYVVHTDSYRRDEAEWYGGRLHVKLEHQNPDMTPERYGNELNEWAKARKARRANGDEQ